ncbi:MAG: hypothetical protein PHI86_04680 [Candidatus Omnitrophica bacterium]|nr:hypothetical protein [Candidatus Omnitrophota bacterium]HOX54827.1 hypothetical protein [Candidatus Omnitrophota bacterium]
MKKGGKGGSHTATGLHFESRKPLEEVIKALPEYSISGDIVYFKSQEVARFYTKNKLYKNLLEPKGVDYKKLISKKLLPDDAIFIFSNNTLFIVEIKFQEVSGSVDEKLQTCDFKNKQYQKLLAPLNITVKYVYVLNDWFAKNEYKDVLEFVKSVGCYYFFNEIPFDFLGLPKP